MAKIKSSWLQWIGCESYPTITDYVGEALALGVSKKITNAGMAKSLVGEDNVVFLAHDNGEHDACCDCVDDAACPACRVNKEHLVTTSEKIKSYKQKVEEAKKNKNSKGEKRALNAVAAHTEALKKLEDEIKNCELCKGSGAVVGSTGGFVEFENEEQMDRVSFQYYSRKPEVWKEIIKNRGEIVEENSVVCETCGGVGWIPKTKIFGFYLPSNVEYMLKEEDNEEIKKEVEANGICAVEVSIRKLETVRKCGLRKAGSYYLTTKVEEATKETTKEIIEKLIAKGLIKVENVEVTGNFCNFIEPIPVEGLKRFRGIKKWSLDPEVEEAFETALEALED